MKKMQKAITIQEMEKYKNYVSLMKVWGMEAKPAKDWLAGYRDVRGRKTAAKDAEKEQPGAPRTVRCFACDHAQEDRGRKKTCEHCGTSPMPSYSYERDNVFHPDRKREG